MAADAQDRMQRLAARVRWSDRLRRPVAIVLATILAPLALYQLREAVHAQWPLVPAILPCAMLGAVLWWAIEAGFALLSALWETEHDRLARASDLPEARLLRRR